MAIQFRPDPGPLLGIEKRPRATQAQIDKIRLIYVTLGIPIPINLAHVSERIAAAIIQDMAKFIAGDELLPEESTAPAAPRRANDYALWMRDVVSREGYYSVLACGHRVRRDRAYAQAYCMRCRDEAEAL